MKPTNHEHVLIICGREYRGAGYHCLCGTLTRTRGEMRSHRKDCQHTLDNWLKQYRASKRNYVRSII